MEDYRAFPQTAQDYKLKTFKLIFAFPKMLLFSVVQRTEQYIGLQNYKSAPALLKQQKQCLLVFNLVCTEQ